MNFIKEMRRAIAEVAFDNGANGMVVEFDTVNNWWNFIVIRDNKATVVQYSPQDFLDVYTMEFEKIKNYLNKGNDSLSNIVCEETKNISIVDFSDYNKDDKIVFKFVYGYLKFMI